MFEFCCIMNWSGLSCAEIVIKIPATTASRMGSLPHYRLAESVNQSLRFELIKTHCKEIQLRLCIQIALAHNCI